MNNDTLVKIFKTVHSLANKNKSLEDFFKSDSVAFLESEIKMLENLIFDFFEIPEDNSLEMHIKYGYTDGIDHPESFCRDYFYDNLYEYYNDTKSIEEIIDIFQNWTIEDDVDEI